MNWDIDKEYRPGRLWIIGRAALAVALMLSYFVLGATLGAGLCYLAYREESVTIIGLLCMVPGAFILVFMLPLPARFVEPGPHWVLSTDVRRCGELISVSTENLRFFSSRVPQ